MIKVVIKAVAFGICLSGLYETLSIPLPPHLIKGGQLQFLTNLSLLVTCVYLFLDLARVKSGVITYYHHLVANLEFNVTIAYWTLILVFPHMLNTDSFEVSYMLDLKIHALPYVILLFDRKRLISLRASFAMTALFISAYFGYTEYIVFSDEEGVTRYPYPFLNGISAPCRLLWVAGFIILSTSNYIVEVLKHKLIY